MSPLPFVRSLPAKRQTVERLRQSIRDKHKKRAGSRPTAYARRWGVSGFDRAIDPGRSRRRNGPLVGSAGLGGHAAQRLPVGRTAKQGGLAKRAVRLGCCWEREAGLIGAVSFGPLLFQTIGFESKTNLKRDANSLGWNRTQNGASRIEPLVSCASAGTR